MVPNLKASYFDGRSGRARMVDVSLQDGQLRWTGADVAPGSAPTKTAVWPERQRHGQRQIQLPGGGLLAFDAAAAFDTWAAAAGREAGLVVRWQQHWGLAALALLLVLASLVGAWRWGIPAAAQAVAAWLPASVQTSMGEQTLAHLDQQWLKPSELPAQTQSAYSQRLLQALAAAKSVVGATPELRLHFRNGGAAFGPNAFALPGGDIVVTDALVKLLEDQPDAVVGVLAHETGHLKHNHGLRQAVQAGIVGVLASWVMGDFSSLLATVPAVLAQTDYSREFEREADTYSREVMRGAGIAPRVMVTFFERLAKANRANDGKVLPIAFSSHPADAARIAFFSQ
jgi:Zn-dependent protease with chaperone function